MSAPQDVAAWMATHEHKDKGLPYIYRYHSRSDIHSIQLCEFIVRDLLRSCETLRTQALNRQIAYGINIKHTWPTTEKAKALDLAIGIPSDTATLTESDQMLRVRSVRPKLGLVNAFSKLLIACEAKAVMTEHGKSQPRLFDELSSSHEIVHQGDQETIAAGIVMVNIAKRFISPLRQKNAGELYWSVHHQPDVAARMIQHLRGLRVRNKIGDVGFDAFCTFVVDCDNQNDCKLHTSGPAPQAGDQDHYDTFVDRITQFYGERFHSLHQ
jgi:hypothetical protein